VQVCTAQGNVPMQTVFAIVNFRGRAGVTKSLHGIRHDMRHPPFVGFFI
jgi:hypothetical protein